MPSYCSNCGEEIRGDEKKCPKCGVAFEGEEIAETRPEVKIESAKTPETDGVLAYLPKKIKKKPLFERLWFLVLTASPFLGLGVLCGIEVAYLFEQILEALEAQNDTGWFSGLAPDLTSLAITFAVIWAILGTGYIIFGVLFAIPGKISKLGLVGGIVLIVAPSVMYLGDTIGQISHDMKLGYPINWPGYYPHFCWAVFAIAGLIITIARLVTLKKSRN